MNEPAPIRVLPADDPPAKSRDKDGLHKRRGTWHYKLKIAGKWKEYSTRTSNYQQARKIRQQAMQGRTLADCQQTLRNCFSRRPAPSGSQAERSW
jgi:hypothetical protein